MDTSIEVVVPNKAWISLKEASALKGVSYKTLCNRTNLQPNHGIPEGRIGGRKLFRRQTVIDWLGKTDDDIETEN